MRWLFYLPTPRSRDGLLRRRPVWPRRRFRTLYARRRYDLAEVGQLAYHVALVVLLLFGCRTGSIITFTLHEDSWALQRNIQMRGIEPPVLSSGEKPTQRLLLYDVVIDRHGREVPFPTAPDSLVEVAYGITRPRTESVELVPLGFSDYTPPPVDSMNARQRRFLESLSEEPRLILTTTADRRTPMDSIHALIRDARVAGIRRFAFAGRPDAPRDTTQR